MAAAVYILCSLVALICAYLLLRAYARGRHRLLLWSGLCFAGLTLNNVGLYLDKIIFTEVDLSVYRSAISLAAMIVLLVGLVWDAR
jgi:hypothetical protein